MLSDESDDSDVEEHDKLGSASGSPGTYCNGLDGFLLDLGIPLSVMISADESCDGDGGSFALP